MQSTTDLSEVKEVLSLIRAEPANEKLATGKWVLLDVKVTEEQFWVAPQNDYHGRPIEGHVERRSETVYVLGRIK